MAGVAAKALRRCEECGEERVVKYSDHVVWRDGVAVRCGGFRLVVEERRRNILRLR